jgi:oligoendopeptidase F
MDRFGGDVDWRGHENDARRTSGIGNCTFSCHPFYYIEYGIAQLGALQVWANSKRDKAKALRDYKRCTGARRFAAVARTVRGRRLQFEFDAATIRPLVELTRKELQRL